MDGLRISIRKRGEGEEGEKRPIRRLLLTQDEAVDLSNMLRAWIKCETDLDALSADGLELRELEAVNFCVSCGKLYVAPEERQWKILCPPCAKKDRDAVESA